MQQQNMGERTPQGTPRHAGPKPLNTPEELRAIRQAMDEGQEPAARHGRAALGGSGGRQPYHQPPCAGARTAAHPGPGVGGTAS